MSKSGSTKGRATSILFTSIMCFCATAHAALVDPSSVTGGWSRSDPGVAYAGWNVFADEGPSGGVILDTTPDVLADTLIGGGTGSGPGSASLGFSATSLTETDGLAFITGGGNIYSFSDPTAFDLALTTIAPSPITQRVLLQVRTLGSELNYAGVRLNGLAADSITELARAPLGGFGGFSVDTLWTWTLEPGASVLSLQFAAAESSVSLDALTVDVAPVPIPGAAWLLGSALVAVANVMRRERQS